MNTSTSPVIYGFQRLTPGNKPAAAISSAPVRDNAVTYKYIDTEAEQKIKEDVYVDDMETDADTREEVDKLKESIKEILNEGGFERY